VKHDLPLVVDFHVHMLEEGVFRASTNKTVFTGFGANPMPAPRPGAAQLMHRMFDPKLEIEDMDARGIDVSVVYPANAIFVYLERDRGLALACMRSYNDWVLDDFQGARTASPAASCCRCRT